MVRPCDVGDNIVVLVIRPVNLYTSGQRCHFIQFELRSTSIGSHAVVCRRTSKYRSKSEISSNSTEFFVPFGSTLSLRSFCSWYTKKCKHTNVEPKLSAPSQELLDVLSWLRETTGRWKDRRSTPGSDESSHLSMALGPRGAIGPS